MNTLFPATYSTLCPVALATYLSERYGLRDVSCKLLVRGVGDTYRVDSAESRYILRVYRSSHRSLPQIEEEMSLLLSLQQAGVSVSYPIPDLADNAIQELNAAEGKRYAALFSYAAGRVVRALSENQLRTLGREVALFHNLSATIAHTGARWTFDTETTLARPFQLLRPAFAGNETEYTWLADRVAQATEWLSQHEIPVSAMGYCHFDLLPKNFHFDGDRVTLFDFDFMGYGPLVNDIMTFWQHLMLEAYAGRMTLDAAKEAYATFIAAYRQYRPISPQELGLVPYLTLGFWLFYMGFHTTHDQFYAFAQPAHVRVYTGFLKYIVQTHWEAETTA